MNYKKKMAQDKVCITKVSEFLSIHVLFVN